MDRFELLHSAYAISIRQKAASAKAETKAPNLRVVNSSNSTVQEHDMSTAINTPVVGTSAPIYLDIGASKRRYLHTSRDAAFIERFSMHRALKPNAAAREEARIWSEQAGARELARKSEQARRMITEGKKALPALFPAEQRSAASAARRPLEPSVAVAAGESSEGRLERKKRKTQAAIEAAGEIGPSSGSAGISSSPSLQRGASKKEPSIKLTLNSAAQGTDTLPTPPETPAQAGAPAPSTPASAQALEAAPVDLIEQPVQIGSGPPQMVKLRPSPNTKEEEFHNAASTTQGLEAGGSKRTRKPASRYQD